MHQHLSESTQTTFISSSLQSQESDGSWWWAQSRPLRAFISRCCFPAAGDPGEVPQTGPNGAMGWAGQWGRGGQQRRLRRWRWVSSIGRRPEPRQWVTHKLSRRSFTAHSSSLCLFQIYCIDIYFCPHNRVQTFMATESLFVFFLIPLNTFAVLDYCMLVIPEASAMIAARKVLQIRRWYTLMLRAEPFCPNSVCNRHKVLDQVLPAWLQRVILVTVWLIT